jgi:integrase
MTVIANNPLPPAPAQLLRHYMRKACACSTTQAYAAQWQRFARWCARRGCASLPAEPHTVAAYLAEQAQGGAAVASIGVMAAAIAFAHRAAGLAFDRDHAALKLVLAGIRREHVRPQLQAEPLTGRLLAEIIVGLGATNMDRRDGALLATLYLFALRASEAAALDWAEPGRGRGWLSLYADRAEVVLMGSKAAPGAVQVVPIPTAPNPRALTAIEAWAAQARLEPGQPLLRPIASNGDVRPVRLGAASISGIVKRALARHFVRTGVAPAEAMRMAARFSSHSGRVGFCVAASEAGALPQHVAAVARHKSLVMAQRYGQRADLLRCAPHRLDGVGV